MAQWQDLIGSMIVGGIILMMLVVFNGNVMESAGIQTFKTAVQGNLTTVAEVIEYDFRKMGYRLSATQDSAILFADSSRIKFQGDFDNNGSIDTIQYYLDTATGSATSNKSDKVLHRQWNRAIPVNMYLGMLTFKIQYYNRADTILIPPVAATGLIKSVKVAVRIESKDRIYDVRRGGRLSNPFADSTYAGAYWERKIKPKNVR